MSYYHSSPRTSRNFGVVGVVIAVIFVLVISIAAFVGAHQEHDYSNCRVSDKDRTMNHDGNSDARIYTDNCGVFKVADTLFKGRFNSADTYNQIKVGKTYNIHAMGYRSGFLSAFPNILSVTEVK